MLGFNPNIFNYSETKPLLPKENKCLDITKTCLETINKSIDGMNIKMSQKNAVVTFLMGVFYFLKYHDFPWDVSGNLLSSANKYLSKEFSPGSFDEKIMRELALNFKDILNGSVRTNDIPIEPSEGIYLSMNNFYSDVPPYNLMLQLCLSRNGDIFFTSDDLNLGSSGQLAEFREKNSAINIADNNVHNQKKHDNNLLHDDHEQFGANNYNARYDARQIKASDYSSRYSNDEENVITTYNERYDSNQIKATDYNSSNDNNGHLATSIQQFRANANKPENNSSVNSNTHPGEDVVIYKNIIDTLINNNKSLKVFSDLINILLSNNEPSRLILLECVSMGKTSCNKHNANLQVCFYPLSDFLFFDRKNKQSLNENGIEQINRFIQSTQKEAIKQKNIDKVDFVKELALIFITLSSEHYLGVESQSIFHLRMFGAALLDYALKINETEINEYYKTHRGISNQLADINKLLREYIQMANDCDQCAQVLVGTMIRDLVAYKMEPTFNFPNCLPLPTRQSGDLILA
ncbi:hypothetical protein PS051_09550 [Escherichia albertii]|uniref:hypothetical protein n=1 Tax=Escherichia albertii TaxID=208962 RepID=UPI00235F2F88|nr:hypothetical protein [Escherichia albertii]MCZ8880353.1 hypothetical protein [Escherichia albertii]WDB90021.1 hypothetical protein PS051_09550 [Escherichia albertii]